MRIYKANEAGKLFTNFKLGSERNPAYMGNKKSLLNELNTLQSLSDIIEPKSKDTMFRKSDIVILPESVLPLFECCLKDKPTCYSLNSGVIDLYDLCETEEDKFSDLREINYFVYNTKQIKNFFDVYPIIHLVSTTNIDTGIMNALKDSSEAVRNNMAYTLIEYIYNPNLTILNINDDFNYKQFLIVDFIRVSDFENDCCCIK